MKKFLPLVLVVVVLIGAGLYIRGKQSVTQIPGKSVGGSSLSDAVSGIGEKIGVVSSIKDAMGLGQKMKCTYTASDGSKNPVTSSVIVEGQKYKFISEAGGITSYGVFDGDTQYIWSTGMTNQGIKMSKACTDELSKLSGTNSAIPVPETPQSLEKSFGEAQGAKCEPSNEDFSIPTDVKFIDECELLKNSLKATEGLKNGQLPAGMNLP